MAAVLRGSRIAASVRGIVHVQAVSAAKAVGVWTIARGAAMAAARQGSRIAVSVREIVRVQAANTAKAVSVWMMARRVVTAVVPVA